MDTSNIKIDGLSNSTGIKIGDNTAPVKVIEFVNLRCPYCRQWFNESKETYETYISSGKVQRLIKLFDKTKPGLDKGNVMHAYVPTQESEALAAISAIYNIQDTWGGLATFEEIAAFAENTLNLTLLDNKKTAAAIATEAADVNVIFVPTMVVGEEVFDQKISQVDFKKILDEQHNK